MKRVLLVILLLIVGFVSGALAMGYLAQRATFVFLEFCKHRYTMEQEILAVRARQRGDLREAARCFKNVAVAADSTGLRCFVDEPKKYWSLDFPIWAIVLREMTSASKTYSKKGIEFDAGLKHGRFAEALEEMGEKEEADKEYQTAARLMGRPDSIEWVKRNVKVVDELDPKLLELQDIYCFPSN